MPRRRIRRVPQEGSENIRDKARVERQNLELEFLGRRRGILEAALSEFTQALQGRVPSPSMLTPETLRYMAERSKTFQAILYRRAQQIAQYAKRPLFDGDTGFQVVPRAMHHEMTNAERAEAKRIEDMLLKTGTVYNPWRKDNLRVALQKLLYDSYVYDAMVVEPILDENGKLTEWYVLDGGSIQLVNPDTYDPQTEAGVVSNPIAYVQVQSEQVKAEWAPDELIYVVRNPSPALERFGYGQPELETLVDVVTIEIEVLTWAKMVLMNSSVPDGLIILESNRDEAPAITPFGSGQSMEDVVRQWRNEVSGAQNAGRLAILQVPRGDKAAFHSAVDKERDMPFAGLYELAQNVICAYMGCLPTEIGIVTGSFKQSSMVDSDAVASQLRYSRLNGLVSVLNAIGEVLEQLIDKINPEFTILWQGIDWTAEAERLTIEERLLKAGIMNVDETRKIRNMPPYGEWWSEIPTLPTIQTAVAQEKGLMLRGVPGQSPGQSPADKGISGKPGSRNPGTEPDPKT